MEFLRGIIILLEIIPGIPLPFCIRARERTYALVVLMSFLLKFKHYFPHFLYK